MSHDYTSLTKVGVAINPASRAVQLKNMIGSELKIYYESPLIENYFKIESEVLEHFKDKRIFGEWINETPENIIAFIDTLNIEGEEYACLSTPFIGYSEEEVKEYKRYNLEDDALIFKNLVRGEFDIYVSNDFIFSVFIQQSRYVYQINFNIYRTARKFATEYKYRVVTVNEETNKFRINDKFHIDE